jgi:hypothetical protein
MKRKLNVRFRDLFIGKFLFVLSVVEPKIENLLTRNTTIVEQRRAAKTKQKCK